MLRRLLASLALLTGLAAVSAPAHAQLIEALHTHLETSERQDQADQQQRCPCEHQQGQARSRTKTAEPCPGERPVRIYLPTVQLGIDLALE